MLISLSTRTLPLVVPLRATQAARLRLSLRADLRRAIGRRAVRVQRLERRARRRRWRRAWAGGAGAGGERRRRRRERKRRQPSGELNPASPSDAGGVAPAKS